MKKPKTINQHTTHQQTCRADGDGISRRRFLVGSSTAVLVTGLGACKVDGNAGSDASVDASIDSGIDAETLPGAFVANLSDVAVGAVIYVSEAWAFLFRDADGLYAVSARCTHLSCLVDDSGANLVCPCHGSEFDYDGNVTVGPATEPLPYYLVIITPEGDIYVDEYSDVPPETRLPV